MEFVGLCVENSRNSFYSLLFYDYFMLLPSDYRKLLLQTLSTLIKSCHPTSPFLSFVSILLRTFEEPQQLDFFFTLLSAQDRHSFHSLHAAPLKELLQSHDPMIRSKSETAILGYVNTPRCRCAQFILILSSISAPLVDKVKRETNALFCELERHFKALILYIESIEYNYRVKSEESSCGNKRKSIQERLQFICGDASTRLLSALTTCVALVSIKALLDEVPASELLQFALMTVGLGVQLCTNDPCKDVLLGCGELTCSLLIRSAAALQTSHLTVVSQKLPFNIL